jgi:upstream activation factor subunit UAF30
MTVLPSERAQYSAIIDDILAEGDLNTISAKQIRRGLQARLGIDISEKKVRLFPFLALRVPLFCLLV